MASYLARKIMDRELISEVTKQISEYFAGQRRQFTGRCVVNIDQRAGTPFQRSVWKTIATIPYGQTRSYAWVAKQLGNSGATRAVGSACGKNSLPIIIPCHRVIKKDGSLGNYTGGGNEMKRLLIDLEKRVLAAEQN